MPPIYQRWLRRVLFIFAFILLLRAIGLFNYLYLTNYSQLQWPHLEAEKLRNEVHLQMQGMPAKIPVFYNLSQFSPIISPKCTNMRDSANSSVLIVVRSAPDRNERRQAIRTTWGLNGPNYGGCHFRTIFVLGSQLAADDFEQELAEENAKYGDLLVGQFFDHYNNATLKTQYALNFAAGHPSSPPFHCATNYSPQFAFLLDDDEFLVPWNLANALAKINPNEHLYSGDAVHDVWPARTAFSKWQITIDEYPFDQYPPYIQGNAMLMSQRTVKAFQIAMQYVKPVIWDDVYLEFCPKFTNHIPFDRARQDTSNGIIAHFLGIEANCQPQIQRYWEGTYELADLIAAHGFTAAQIRANYFELKDKLFGAM